MKNIAAIKRNNRKIHARKFLSTPEGKAWLERKQRENEERKLLSELKWLKDWITSRRITHPAIKDVFMRLIVKLLKFFS